MKKYISFSAFLISLSVSMQSCVLTQAINIGKHDIKTGEQLPNTFRTEIPMRIDPTGYFCIKGIINGNVEQDFIIDTKAGTLIKQDDTSKLKISCFGKLPLLKTKNAMGQKTALHLYYFDSINIKSLCFMKPLFYILSPENWIYHIMYKNVLGQNILSTANWKFAIDDNTITVFSKKDTVLLRKETEGYIKIKNGLKNNGVRLKISQLPKEYKFMCDLGFNGEIAINRSIFKNLSKKYSYKKFVRDNYPLENDTVYSFENITVQWDGITIPCLQVCYTSRSNYNLVGAKFMQRFNFVLKNKRFISEQDISDPDADIFIKPVKNFESIKSTPYISVFGFNIVKTNYIKVSAIEVGGIADRAGLQAGDRVISIDGGAFALDTEYVFNRNLIDYLADKNTVSLQIERQGKSMEIKLEKN